MQATTLQFWHGDQLVSRKFVVTELQKEFDAILGTPFLREYNPDIDWNLGIISMPNSQVKLSAIVQSRTAYVEIVSAKKWQNKLIKLEFKFLKIPSIIMEQIIFLPTFHNSITSIMIKQIMWNLFHL